jgi:hypothetical protein
MAPLIAMDAARLAAVMVRVHGPVSFLKPCSSLLHILPGVDVNGGGRGRAITWVGYVFQALEGVAHPLHPLFFGLCSPGSENTWVTVTLLFIAFAAMTLIRSLSGQLSVFWTVFDIFCFCSLIL